MGLCVAFVTAPCTLRSSVIASPPSLALYRAFLFFAPPPLCARLPPGYPFFGLWYPFSQSKNPWKNADYNNYR